MATQSAMSPLPIDQVSKRRSPPLAPTPFHLRSPPRPCIHFCFFAKTFYHSTKPA